MQHLYGGQEGCHVSKKVTYLRGRYFSNKIQNWVPESILYRYSNNVEHQWCNDGLPLTKEATLMCPTLQSWMSALNENLLHAGSPVSNMTKNIIFLSSGTFHLLETEQLTFPCCTGNFTFNKKHPLRSVKS